MTNTMVDQLGATRRDLLGRAAEIALTIREFAPVAERERRLSDPVVAAMLEAGLFTMARARSYGGLELDPVGRDRKSVV